MWNIAINTFREIVRNKFFSLILFFGVVFLCISLALRTLALGEIERMLYDFGLSFIEITGVLVVLFLGGGMLTREIEGRTIYLLLSKPISRRSILLGKFVGFSFILALIISLLSLLLLFLLWWSDVTLDTLLPIALLGIYLKLLILLSVILFFSTVASPILSMFVTIAFYFIGHNAYVMLDFATRKQDIFFDLIGRTVVTIFPNLEILNLKTYIATGAHFAPMNLALGYSSSILYISIVLLLATLLFQRKSFDTV